MEDGDFSEEREDGPCERKGKALVTLSERIEQVELGFTVEVSEREERLRGHFDASRVMRDHPRLVGLVEWLLGLKFVPWDVIAAEAGMTWATVSAIAAARKESVKEFKCRNAHSIKLVIEAALPGMMEKAKAGKFTPFDLKVLVDAYLLMAGEATSILGVPEKLVDPEEAALMRMLAEPARTALGMGSEVGKLSAMAERSPVVLDGETGEPVDN